MRKRSLSLSILTLFCWISAFAINVENLNVNSLENPTGVNPQSAYFGWKIKSEDKTVVQTAYNICIFSDKSLSECVFSTDWVESDQSQFVKIPQLNLNGGSHYYWNVQVKDNKGNTVQSTKCAYFVTALSDVFNTFSGSKWIKLAQDKPYGSFIGENAKNYELETEVTVVSGGASLCFCKAEESSYRLCHIEFQDGKAKLMLQSYYNNTMHDLAEVNLDENVGISLGTPFRLKMAITNDNKKLSVFVNDIKVDERDMSTFFSAVGYAVLSDEEAYFDNLYLLNLDNGLTLLSESFNNTTVLLGGENVNGQLHLKGSASTPVCAWQPSGRVTTNIEVDMSVIRGNPSVIFGHTADRAFFKWQLFTSGVSKPVLRRYVKTFANEWYEDLVLDDFTISDFINVSHHWQIVANDFDITTMIDGKTVDVVKCPVRRIPIGKVGFYADVIDGVTDEVLYDNLSVIYKYPDEGSFVSIDEDFESKESLYFINHDVVDVNGNRKCKVLGKSGGALLLQLEDEIPTFYTDIMIEKPVKSAMLYTSALGVYDLWLNGERVGHLNDDGSSIYEEMKPGWTDYRKRVFYSTHDVTHLCTQGINILGATVTSGWLWGRIARNYYSNINLAFIAKLVITYSDGSTEEISTDETWRASLNGPLMKSDIYMGEYYDSRRDHPWTNDCYPHPYKTEVYEYAGVLEPTVGPYVKALNDLSFTPDQITLYDGTLEGPDYGMVNVTSTYSNVSSFRLKKGETAIVDFGQNFSGTPRFKVKGNTGCRLHIRTAEMLNDTGEKSRGNDGPGGSIYRENLRVANSEIHYVLNGDTSGEEYQSNTSFYGYRYCELTASEDIEILNIVSVPWSSSYDDTGEIQTSDPTVNRLFENIVWGQRSNLLSVPTDCPQRDERLGWTADTQIFSITGMYNANVSEFYRKWLQDLRDGQKAEGMYSDLAPENLNNYGNGAWTDAGIIVPWNVYLMTGNKDVLAESFDSMNRYMDWLSTKTDGSIKYPGGDLAYGDWLAFCPTNKRFVSQAYYAYDALLMSKMAEVLSESSDDIYAGYKDHYATLYEKIRSEIQAMYFGYDGLLEPTQTSCVLALHFDLCIDDTQKANVAAQLASLIEANGYKLDTGFVGTAYLNTALADNGLSDYAYDLLLQRDFPSWLYSVDQGATTMWERWNSYTLDSGFGNANMNSFNHYAYGAVGEWMYRSMAGIKPTEEAPGFKKIVFQPKPDMRTFIPEKQKRINEVQASFESFYGSIGASWTLDDTDRFSYDIIVPPNTTAEVWMPVYDETTTVYVNGFEEDSNASGVSYIDYQSGCKIYSVGSGKYNFISNTSTSILDIPIKIGVFPNPVDDKLNISIDQDIISATLINLSGQTIMVWNGGENILDFTQINPNYYILKVQTPDNCIAVPVIKR